MSALRFCERWYTGYAFQGAVVLGVAPILLPIVVNSANGPAAAGTAVAFFYIGQLLAPLLGGLTDRTRQYHAVYLAGYALLAVALALFPLTDVFWFWLALAFLQGAGAAATNTVAAMCLADSVVEGLEYANWAQRRNSPPCRKIRRSRLPSAPRRSTSRIGLATRIVWIAELVGPEAAFPRIWSARPSAADHHSAWPRPSPINHRRHLEPKKTAA